MKNPLQNNSEQITKNILQECSLLKISENIVMFKLVREIHLVIEM